MHLRSSQPREHEANHGQVNHRFARASLPLVVATESTVTAEPTKGTLHHPASGQYFEDVKVGSFHDLDGAAPQFPTPVQQGARVATVGPDVFDASASLLVEEGCEQLLGSIAVLNVGRQDHHQQQQSDRVDQNVSFASVDLFARVVAPLVADLAAFDTLTVDDARAGLGLAPLGQADVFAQVRVNLLPQAIAFPESEVVIDRTPGSKVSRQIAPLATSFDQVKDGIDQLPEGVFPWPSLFAGPGKAVIDELPFGVVQVRCISHRKRITACGTKYKLTLKKC
jgi:hypothetical protein